MPRHERANRNVTNGMGLRERGEPNTYIVCPGTACGTAIPLRFRLRRRGEHISLWLVD